MHAWKLFERESGDPVSGLMANHVHFICVPKKEDPFPRTFNMLLMRYAQYINRRKNATTGHPSGDGSFIKVLERMFGRRLIALPHGRPRKEGNK